MEEKMTENKKEKWKQVLQLIKVIFISRWCNMNVASIKINR